MAYSLEVHLVMQPECEVFQLFVGIDAPTDAARQIAELPQVRYPAIGASRIGWACVRELGTLDARQKLKRAWEKGNG